MGYCRCHISSGTVGNSACQYSIDYQNIKLQCDCQRSGEIQQGVCMGHLTNGIHSHASRCFVRRLCWGTGSKRIAQQMRVMRKLLRSSHSWAKYVKSTAAAWEWGCGSTEARVPSMLHMVHLNWCLIYSPFYLASILKKHICQMIFPHNLFPIPLFNAFLSIHCLHPCSSG